MLYGRPPGENPHGRQLAGTPAWFLGFVILALRGAALDHASWYAGSGPTWISCVMRHAGSPPAGPAITSTESSSLLNCAVNTARFSRAAASCCGVTCAPIARNSRMYGPYSFARDG